LTIQKQQYIIRFRIQNGKKWKSDLRDCINNTEGGE